MEPQGGGGGPGHEGLVVAVVRVAEYRQNVSHGEDDGGHPGQPEKDLNLEESVAGEERSLEMMVTL